MEINWKEVGLVIFSGAIGGMLSLVYTVTIGKPPSIEGYWTLPAYLFLGAGSGYFGVYLIAKTDTRHLAHCLGFAAACGLSWAPIMDAAGALVQQASDKQLQSSVEDLTKKANHISLQLKEGINIDTPKLFDQLANTVSLLIESSSKTDSMKVKFKAQKSTNSALEALETVIDSNPEKVNSMITEITTSAILFDETDIATNALNTLENINLSVYETRFIPMAYDNLGRIAEIAKAKGNLSFAIDAKLVRAGVILNISEKALARKNYQVIRNLPLKGAKVDLQDGQKFFEAAENTNKVEEINRKIEKIKNIAIIADEKG